MLSWTEDFQKIKLNFLIQFSKVVLIYLHEEPTLGSLGLPR